MRETAATPDHQTKEKSRPGATDRDQEVTPSEGYDMTTTNAAIETLESQRSQLTDGLNSIAEQQKNLKRLQESLDLSTKKLARDKSALIEIDNALNILRAGESA